MAGARSVDVVRRGCARTLRGIIVRPPVVSGVTAGERRAAATSQGAKPAPSPRALRAAAAVGMLATGGLGYVAGHDLAEPSAGSGAVSIAGAAPSGPRSSPTSPGAGSSGRGPRPSAVGAPADMSSIARGVDAGLVDVDTTLRYQGEQAAGTGMVLSSNGEILTNNHVVEGATSISVTDVGNARTYAATVVGYDRSRDVAVLQLESASGLGTVALGNSAAVRDGEAVVGIGNAGGSGGAPSYAGGSITGLGRSVTARDGGQGTSEHLAGLIETNADIQPGDSGGPLVDASGQVVGMDTARSAGSGGVQLPGIGASASGGFAIPIDEAARIAAQIEAGTSSSSVHVGATAFLGVQLRAPGTRSSLGSSGPTSQGAATPGAEIVGVVPGSAAARVGLVAGDTITSLGGRSITSPGALSALMAREHPGASLPLVYVGSTGAQRAVTAHLGSGPPQ